MKDMENDTNKYTLPRSQVGTFQYHSNAQATWRFYRFNAEPAKIPRTVFTEQNMLLGVMCSHRGPQRTEATSSEMNKVEDTIIPEFKCIQGYSN